MAQQILNGEAVSSLSSKDKMTGGSRGFKSFPLIFLIMFGIVNDSDTTTEFFDVRTAWHGPNNVDPVGHCYNLHLNLVTPNFGIQEETFFDEKTREVFRAPLKFASAISTPTISRVSALTSTKRRPLSILTRPISRAGGTTACWMER
jgi:hypothetical protein